MTEKKLKAETATIRRDITELKRKLQNAKDTYREIEIIAAELKKQVA